MACANVEPVGFVAATQSMLVTAASRNVRNGVTMTILNLTAIGAPARAAGFVELVEKLAKAFT